MKKYRILYIDMMNLFIRCFAVLPFSNEQGDHVGALFGCLNSFNSLLNKFRPVDIVVCAWEGKGSAKRRRDIMEEYKAGRKFTGFNKIFEGDVEEEKRNFSNQLKKIREYISLLPFYQASIEYLEADDVVAYMTQKIFNDEEQFENVMITCDRDYFQLVNDNTTVFRPVKTKANKGGKLYDTDAIIEETGCHPSNYIISKCIVGDGSDGIDGIKRVGQKTVIKDFPFLSSLKNDSNIYSIDDVLDSAKWHWQHGNKRYEKYIIHRDLIIKNFKLMQLLDPDISLTAVKNIEQTFSNYKPRFYESEFRMLLIRDEISPRNISRWVNTFSDVHPLKIDI